MVKYLENENFKEVIGEGVWVVDFYADWCGPCKMMEPIMEEIANEIKVYKVNVDDNQELAEKYGVISIPCIVKFNSGKDVDRSIGLKSKDAMLDFIK